MTDGFAAAPSQPESEAEVGEVEAGEMRAGEAVAGQTETRDAGFSGIPSWEVAADIWREVWIEEVHHSTGLGGNSLSRNEVERLLVDGRAVGSRLLVEYLYVRGYGDASRWVCQQALVPQVRDAGVVGGEGDSYRGEAEIGKLAQEKIGALENPKAQDEFAEPKSLVTLEEICFLHEQIARLPWAATHSQQIASPSRIESLLIQTGAQTASARQQGVKLEGELQQISQEGRPGRFRERELPDSAEGITPVSWRFVPAEMEKWLAQANEMVAAETLASRKAGILNAGKAGEQGATEVLERAETLAIQEMSEALARIHIRFVKTQPFATANGLAARLAANLLLVRRGLPPAIIQKRQRSAYQQALQRADLGNFAQLANLFAQGIFRSLSWFAQPEPEEGLVPLSALATEEINVAALRVAAARGRLRAKRPPGGRWLSTPEWVADYIATRHRRQSHSVG